ncbi:MAG: prepilin-type N-terminal cleavage/methylation domain-containing protein [Desulfotomaculaceae bacterium]|nr:prepilin-type N-terminal cleavage/methylation domain-containing protein [Desulfotomaculaceae bacterium]
MEHLHDERGFTLAELMLSILLLSILFLAAFGLFAQGFVFWKQGEHKVDMYDSLRISLDRMGREMRYTEGISSASDINNLCFKTAEGKNVKYYCSAHELIRGEQGASGWGYNPVASDIESIKFVYTTSAGAVINESNIAQHKQLYPTTWTVYINLVTITITAKKEGSNVDPVVLTQKVSLRALP